MPPDQNELEKFLGNLTPGSQPVDQPVTEPAEKQPEAEPAKVEGEEEGTEGEPHKNRRHRRWEDRLGQRERELIAREARLSAIEELGGAPSSTDVDPRLLRLYGDNEQGRLAAALTAEVLSDATRQAEDRAYARFEREQEAAVAEERDSEAFIDDQLEALEDDNNIDLTSNAPAARKVRRDFLELVEKLSPKDDEGNITEYADFGSTFDLYRQQSAAAPSAARNKELAGRGMQKPTSSEGAQAQSERDTTRDWLRSQGINV